MSGPARPLRPFRPTRTLAVACGVALWLAGCLTDGSVIDKGSGAQGVAPEQTRTRPENPPAEEGEEPAQTDSVDDGDQLPDGSDDEPVLDDGDEGNPEDQVPDDEEQPDDEEPPDDEEETDPPSDELTGFIGSPCESDRDCDYDGAVCLTEADGFPRGMCSQSCDRICPDEAGYPVTFCIESEGMSTPACHSRCDYLAYPGLGCRGGYACRVTGRAGEPGTTYGTCVPDDGAPQPGLTECQQWLVDNGIFYEPTTYEPQRPSDGSSLTCTVEDPVRLHSPVHGVNYRYYYDEPGDFRPMLMSCHLARAIAEMTDILLEYDITEVVHIGTTVCRTISGTNTLSQHALGLAIDLGGFFDDGANWYGVYDHWEHGTDAPDTPEGQLLLELAWRLYDERVFNVILTPEYNAAHDNHFHVDLTYGSHFIGSHEEWEVYMGPNVHGD